MATVNISITLMVNAREVSFTRVITSFVMEGRIPLYHLGKDNSKEGLRPAVAQHLCSLILAGRHGLNTAAVNFRKIGRIVDHKANKGRPQPVIISHPDSQQVIGAENTPP